MKEEQTRVYLPKVSPEISDLVETESLKPCIFDLIDGIYTKEFADKVQVLPRFELVAWPREIPPGLLELPSNSEVIFRQGQIDRVATVGLVLDCFKSKMERQSKGFFELSEAAEILSNSICDEWGERMPKEKMWAEMKDAFLTGVLTFYDEYKQPLDLAKLRRMNDIRSSLYAPDYNMLGMYGETTTPQAINQWLEGMGSPHRFPEPVETPAQPATAAPEPQAGPEPVQAAEADRLDLSMLATPDELIEAFGRSAGMGKSWFGNITDKPGLEQARRVKGARGRGGHKPLFCPLAVMQWLADDKRKVGRPISEEKAWSLLESHFPRVYAAHAAADPR